MTADSCSGWRRAVGGWRGRDCEWKRKREFSSGVRRSLRWNARSNRRCYQLGIPEPRCKSKYILYIRVHYIIYIVRAVCHAHTQYAYVCILTYRIKYKYVVANIYIYISILSLPCHIEAFNFAVCAIAAAFDIIPISVPCAFRPLSKRVPTVHKRTMYNKFAQTTMTTTTLVVDTMYISIKSCIILPLLFRFRFVLKIEPLSKIQCLKLKRNNNVLVLQNCGNANCASPTGHLYLFFCNSRYDHNIFNLINFSFIKYVRR